MTCHRAGTGDRFSAASIALSGFGADIALSTP
jgi:hypothetical protein